MKVLMSFVANFNPSWDKSSLGNYSWVGRKTTNKTYKSLWIWHKLKRERTNIKRELYLVGETRNKSCPYLRKGSGVGGFFAHLSWKLKWAFQIAHCPYDRLLTFQIFIFSRTTWPISLKLWHKSFVGEGDSGLFRGRITIFSKRRYMTK